MNVAIATQPAPSGTAAAFLKKPPRLLVNGEWIDSASGTTVPVVDPATGRQIAVTADANAADVDRAVAAARRALEEGPWSKMHPADRGKLVYKLGELVREHARELAEDKHVCREHWDAWREAA